MLNLIEQSNPILHTTAAEVDAKQIANLKPLVTEMREIMTKKQGIGLAAPQVGFSIRLIVVQDGDQILALFNPEITEKSPEQELSEEGCLSCPGIYMPVLRAKKVTVTAITENGKNITLEAAGYLARILQHEIDHLFGKLITDAK